MDTESYKRGFTDGHNARNNFISEVSILGKSLSEIVDLIKEKEAKEPEYEQIECQCSGEMITTCPQRPKLEYKRCFIWKKKEVK